MVSAPAGQRGARACAEDEMEPTSCGKDKKSGQKGGKPRLGSRQEATAGSQKEGEGNRKGGRGKGREERGEEGREERKKGATIPSEDNADCTRPHCLC